jgi:uncharacterized protein YbjT (DUF2867 family)
MSEKFLVIGASGSVGSGVARHLREQGRSVRTTTSKKDAANVDRVHVDLTTGKGVQEAFAGIDRAFLMSPAGYADQYAILAPLIQAAKQHGLKKLVLMSAFGADGDPTSPLRRSELALEQSGLAYNIIRPNWFMQNFHTFWLHGIQAQNTIALPAGEAKTSFIDTRDIAEVAARLLVSDNMNNRAFNLTGPDAISHAQAAHAISEVSGRTIAFQDAAPEDVRKGLVGAGLTDAYADMLIVIFGYLKAGYNASATDDVRAILGRAPIGFQKYAQDNRSAWV